MTSLLAAVALVLVLVGVRWAPSIGEVNVPGPPGTDQGASVGRGEPPRVESIGPLADLRCLDDTGQEVPGCTSWVVRTSDASQQAVGPLTVMGPVTWTWGPAGIAALSTRDGSERWTTAIAGAVTRRVAVDRTRLVAVDDDGMAYGLRHLDGAVIWRTPLDDRPVADPVLADGIAVFPTRSGLVGIRAGTGGVAFRSSLGAAPGALAVVGHRILAADDDGHVYALEPSSGEILWQTPAGASSPWLVPAGRDLVVAVTRGGEVSAIDVEGGSVRWRRTVGPVDQPAVGPDGRRLYVPTADPVVTARIFEVDGGREVGQVGLGSSVLELAVDPQGWLLVTSPDRVTVRDPVDGRPIVAVEHGSARVERSDATFLTTNARRGRVVVAFDDGTVGGLEIPRRPSRLDTVRAGLEQDLTVQLEPEEPCPTSPVDRRPYGEVSVGAGIEVAVSDDPAQGRQVTVYDTPVDLPDPVVFAAARLDAPGSATLTGPSGQPGEEILLAARDRRFRASYPPHWTVGVDAPRGGCWAYVVRTPDEVDVVVVDLGSGSG